jgi:L-amino acid N-acyltransferase YncA
MKIRTATEKDLEAINNIYNQAIPYEMSTADMIPYTMAERQKWFKIYDRSKYPVFVAEKNDEVAGYFSFSPYRPRRLAMRYTAEISYFVDEKYRNIGIGTSLMSHAISKAPGYNFKTLIAMLLAHNTVSIKLLEKFGFREWGRMPGVTDFNGKERDHLYYGLRVVQHQV